MRPVRATRRIRPPTTSPKPSIRDHYLRAAADAAARQRRILSLYVHIPFCDTVCYYCACNKIVTKNRAHARPYLDRLKREIALQAALLRTTRQSRSCTGAAARRPSCRTTKWPS